MPSTRATRIRKHIARCKHKTVCVALKPNPIASWRIMAHSGWPMPSTLATRIREHIARCKHNAARTTLKPNLIANWRIMVHSGLTKAHVPRECHRHLWDSYIRWYRSAMLVQQPMVCEGARAITTKVFRPCQGEPRRSLHAFYTYDVGRIDQTAANTAEKTMPMGSA